MQAFTVSPRPLCLSFDGVMRIRTIGNPNPDKYHVLFQRSTRDETCHVAFQSDDRVACLEYASMLRESIAMSPYWHLAKTVQVV
jgi:hypothetical protein